ncbi:hypothetical protein D3C86_1629350 [compost metagenome]
MRSDVRAFSLVAWTNSLTAESVSAAVALTSIRRRAVSSPASSSVRTWALNAWELVSSVPVRCARLLEVCSKVEIFPPCWPWVVSTVDSRWAWPPCVCSMLVILLVCCPCVVSTVPRRLP